MRGLDVVNALELSRIRLRQLRETDSEALFAYYQDPHVTRYLDWNGPRDTGHAREVIRVWNEGFDKGWILRLGIAEKETDLLIGTIFFTHFDGCRAELGYELAKPYWGKGIMTEAAEAMLQLGFSGLSISRVQAFVYGPNYASSALLRRLGFTFEGTLQQYETHTVTGELRDMDLYARLSDEKYLTGAQFEPISARHLPDMARLYADAFNAPPWNDEWTPSKAELRIRQAMHSEGFDGLVSLRKGRVTGLILGNAEPYYNGMHFFIKELCVDIALRGQGFGSMLLEAFTTRLKASGIDEILLFTGDKEAGNFYVKHGFRVFSGMVMMGKEL